VTLDGYVDASLLGPARDSFAHTIRAPSGARLRGAARGDASIIADLRDGMGITILSRQGSWVRVRRTGWVPSNALGSAPRATAVATPSRDSEPRRPAATATRPPQSPGTLTPGTSATVHTSPGGDSIGRVARGATLTPLARADGWTRVRIDGWVRDDDLVPADSSLRLSLSAADIRASPDESRGAVVRWTVQFIALQRADALRPDLRPNEPYMLARGPAGENALLYIAVPPALLAQVEGLTPLDEVALTARVRAGRSAPVGVPLLDLLTISRE
jgi:hypothetical protein